ncbi:MAG: AsmA family protein [Pseudomonadota bacterium]|nr:AsmA family protein [Pseudomonadota bacterium]
MKKFLIGIVIVVVILLAAALIIPAFIPADTYKRLAIEKVQAATGRTLAVGDFHVRLFPAVGVTMDNATLSNPPSYGDAAPLLAAKSLKVDVVLLPLLSGKIEVGEVILDSPDIHLHVTKDGVKNWQMPQQQKAPAPAAVQAESHQATVPVRDISLSGLSISNGAIAYDNDAAGQHWQARALDIDLAMHGMHSPLSFDAKGEWNGRKIAAKGKFSSLGDVMGGGRAEGSASISSELLSVSTEGVIAQEAYSGKADIKSSSLKALQQWLDPAAKPVDMASSLAFHASGNVQCSADSCAFDKADISLDSLKATGSLRVRKGTVPEIGADLAFDTLDLNPFLPQAHAEAAGIVSDALAAEPRWSDKPIDLSGLKAIDATFHITAGNLLYRKLTADKLNLQGQLKSGELQASANAGLYDGTGDMALTLNAAASSLQSRAALKGVQAEKLLEALADSDRISGAADLQLNVQSHGGSERELVSALAGTGQLKLNNGAIKGTNLLAMAQNVGSAFAQAGSSSESTPINNLSGNFTIAGGVVSNKDLVMATPSMRLAGQGDISLPTWSINYRLTPQVAGSREGVGVPVIVTGSLDRPHFQPDVNAIAQQAIQNPDQFKQQLKNTRENFKDQLKNPQDAVKNLKGLLKGF